MSEEYTIETDHLAVALTRPPMLMGVNIRLLFGNVSLCALICIDAHTLMGVPLFILLHVLMVKFSIKEPNFLYLWVMSFIKTPPVLNRWYWGRTNSYEPW
jgi:type IV secretory pathway VirB3-like protein